MAKKTVKTVKGIRYLYFTYYDSSRKKQVELYCGPEKSADALKKLDKLRRDYLEKQRRSSELKTRAIEQEIAELDES